MLQGCTRTAGRKSGVLRRVGAVTLACVALASVSAVSGCGSTNSKVSAARERIALRGRIEDELGDQVRLLSRTMHPASLAPGWHEVMPGGWFHAQKGFVPTMFIIEKPVGANTTTRDVLDGGREHDAASTDNFVPVSTMSRRVLGGVRGVAYVNHYDSGGEQLAVTGELTVVNGHLYNAYITSPVKSTAVERGAYNRMLDSIRIAAPT